MQNKTAIAHDAHEATDAELIHDFVSNASNAAFETLVRRHYNIVHRRLLSITQNHADADDLAQKLWLRVLEHLPNYQDKQKFPHFLNTIATNLVKDEWRKSSVRNNSSLDEMMEKSHKDTDGNIMMVDDADVADTLANRSEITHLVTVLIPKLTTKLRAVFLLRHESEYWDGKQPFQWQHLGELNSMSADQAYERFVTTRDSLVTGSQEHSTLSEENRLIFLTWTQAQRLQKANKQTETYLASLLNIPVNTFKTRYRAALKELSQGLERWKNQQATSQHSQ